MVKITENEYETDYSKRTVQLLSTSSYTPEQRYFFIQWVHFTKNGNVHPSLFSHSLPTLSAPLLPPHSLW